MDEDNLDGMLAEVKEAAANAGAYVVDAVLSLNDAKVPVAGTDPAATAALIRAVRPRVVYCTGIQFDAGQQVLIDLFDEDADEALLQRPRVKRLVARWRKRDGQTAQIFGSVMVDGILHGFLMEAPWYSEYEKDVEEHGEESDRIRDERARREEAEVKRRLGPMVDKLLADPRFSGSKVGRAKRATLAQSLFPDVERRTLDEVVTLAESRHWLASG